MLQCLRREGELSRLGLEVRASRRTASFESLRDRGIATVIGSERAAQGGGLHVVFPP